jgi:hypothetical protein
MQLDATKSLKRPREATKGHRKPQKQSESRRQLATKSYNWRQLEAKSDKRRQLETVGSNWRQEEQRVLRWLGGYWNIKKGGGVFGILDAKSCRTKRLRCGAFYPVAPQTRHNQN